LALIKKRLPAKEKIMDWIGAIARIFPKRFAPYYSLILVFTSVSACAQTSHKQYQYYDFNELCVGMGASYLGGPRTIPDGTAVAVHGTVRGSKLKEVLEDMQDPEYREKSKRSKRNMVLSHPRVWYCDVVSS
jgi:hypothetical protein